MNGIFRERDADFLSAFYSDGGAEETHLEENNFYIDLSDDSEGDL